MIVELMVAVDMILMMLMMMMVVVAVVMMMMNLRRWKMVACLIFGGNFNCRQKLIFVI